MKDLSSLTKKELIALLNKKDEEIKDVLNELLSTKDELSSTKNELTSTKDELSSTKDELSSTKDEFLSSSNELSSAKDELVQAKEELVQAKEELELLRVSNRELNEKINDLIKKYEEKTELNRKLIIDTYTPKSEKLKDIVINELEETLSDNKKKNRKTPYSSIVTVLY